MAGSKRKEIRREIVRRIKGNTDAGENVFSNSTTPSWDENLPVILVYPQSEDLRERSQAPREFIRDLSISIEITAGGPEEPFLDGKKSVEDQLDDIAYQVEQILSSDDSLGCRTDDLLLSNLEFQFEGEGARPIGTVRLIYLAKYVDNFPDNADGLADFKTADADWHVGHDDDSPDLTDKEAEDTIDIPQ